MLLEVIKLQLIKLMMVDAVNEWLSSFEQRILPLMDTKIVLDDAEIVRLGKKVATEYPYCFKFCDKNGVSDCIF